MFTKKLIAALCFVATGLTHGAAEDAKNALITSSSKPSNHDFIGLVSRTNGSCMMLTPEHVEPGKDFPITVVYTEMPELKTEETLSKIVALFAEVNRDPHFTEELFDATLQKMIDEYAVKSKAIGVTHNELNLDAIILCVKLSQSAVDSYGSAPRYYFSASKLKHGMSTRYVPLDEEPIFCEWSGVVCHAEYDKPLPCSPQEHANAKLNNGFFAKFTKFALVLDIKKWRELYGSICSSSTCDDTKH